MKSIEKLRRVAEEQSHEVMEALGAAIDEIEEELARDYVELPKDKDGIPIRPDDEIVVHHQGMEPVYSTVTALILTDRWDFEQSCYETDSRDVNDLRDFYENVSHVQPDSWERIIEDACRRAIDGYPDETGEIAMKDLIERCKALAGVE